MPLGARTGFKKKSYGFKETVSIAKPAGVTEITLERLCARGLDLQEAQAQRLKKKYPFSCHFLLDVCESPCKRPVVPPFPSILSFFHH